MTNFIKAATFNNPDTIPVRIGCLPAAWMKYREALSDIAERYPSLFGDHNRMNYDYDACPASYNAGKFTDAWGCEWSNVKEGMESIVTGHPYPTRESVRLLKAPSEDIGTPHGFMYLRLCDLRGFEEIMFDFAEEAPELQMIINAVLSYNLEQVEKRLQIEKSEVMYFGDDLGLQHSLPISPVKWRKFIQPCYKKIYDLCLGDNRYVYMHSDGCIFDIIPDLIDCGVTIINPQYRANGIDNLVKVCKDKICVALDLDRQMFPFCTPADIDDHIRESVVKLASPRGGLMLVAECAQDVPLENIEAICKALEKYSHWKL